MEVPSIEVGEERKETDTVAEPVEEIAPEGVHYGVFDLETQRSAEEVGGWNNADKMGISCAVLYDSKEDRCFEYLEDGVDKLIEHMKSLPLIVGFNIKRFDYFVLKGYSDFDFLQLKTLDILEEVYNRLNYRLSLDGLATVTLGAAKSANGLLALQWWKEGRVKEIVEYCAKDVELTRQLFLFGKKNKYLLYKNKAGNMVRVPVGW